MNELVFLESRSINSKMYTTSDVIAQYAGISHHAVRQQIAKHEQRLMEYGLVAFEMRAVKMTRGIKYIKNYHLNEQQATLLVTFLKNTEPVIRFKTELVGQFFVMRTELTRRKMQSEAMKPSRRRLTDVIKEIGHNHWDYKKYTDLSYKVVTGMCAKQLRTERGALPNDKANNFLTAVEIEAVAIIQDRIGVLLEMGMDYEQIKGLVINSQKLKKIA